jgi:hypothetical protein
MIKPAALLLALVTVALLVHFDRDGILAHSDLVTRALGVELRIELTVERSSHPPVAPVAPVAPLAPLAPVVCE